MKRVMTALGQGGRPQGGPQPAPNPSSLLWLAGERHHTEATFSPQSASLQLQLSVAAPLPLAQRPGAQARPSSALPTVARLFVIPNLRHNCTLRAAPCVVHKPTNLSYLATAQVPKNLGSRAPCGAPPGLPATRSCWWAVCRGPTRLSRGVLPRSHRDTSAPINKMLPAFNRTFGCVCAVCALVALVV